VAATSNVQVGQTTYPIIGGGEGEWREGSEGQSHKEEKREGWSGRKDGALGLGGLYLDIYAGAPDFLVKPLLMEPVCLLS